MPWSGSMSTDVSYSGNQWELPSTAPQEDGTKQELQRVMIERFGKCDGVLGVLTVRRSVYPLFTMMKLSGLHFGPTCPLVDKIGLMFHVERLYSLLVILLLTVNCIRMLVGFAIPSNYSLYVYSGFALWTMRCTIQGIYCAALCWKTGKGLSEIQKITLAIDENLCNLRIDEKDKATRQFLYRSWGIYLFLSLISLTNAITVLFGLFAPIPVVNAFFDSVLHPFPVHGISKIAVGIAHWYDSQAWAQPIMLHCQLCNCLSFLFDKYHEVFTKENSLNMKTHISLLRKSYLDIAKVACKTDDHISFLAFCTFLFDIVLFCINLYIVIFVEKDSFSLGVSIFWTCILLATMVITAYTSSLVAERGTRVCELIQDIETSEVDPQSNSELTLFLCYVNNNPVVMTIWKLIPLHKSIVVSVFVSLITYFTLMIQFKA